MIYRNYIDVFQASGILIQLSLTCRRAAGDV